MSARSNTIDTLKFAAIVLVIVSHVGALPQYAPWVVAAVRHVSVAINMPLFMCLSGYVLFGREGSAPARFVGRKFMALIVPYFAWYAFVLMRDAVPLGKWPGLMIEAVINPHNPQRLWFLYVLFVLYVIFTLVRLVSRTDVALVVATVAVTALTLLPDGDYFGRLNVQWLFGFFVLGYLAAKHRSRLPKASVALAVVTSAVCVALLALGWPLDPSGWPPYFMIRIPMLAVYPNPTFMLWKYLTAVSAIAACALVVGVVPEERLARPAFAGRRTMGMYCIQGSLLGLSVGGGAFGVAFSTVLIVILALGAALVIEKGRWSAGVLLGQWPRRPLSPAGTLEIETEAARPPAA